MIQIEIDNHSQQPSSWTGKHKIRLVPWMDKAFACGYLAHKERNPMSLYDDKGLEEIQEIVHLFKETYRARYGHEPDTQILKVKLEQLVEEKKERHFRSVFESMSTNNIYMAMNAFDADAVRNSGQAVKASLEEPQEQNDESAPQMGKRGKRKAKQ